MHILKDVITYFLLGIFSMPLLFASEAPIADVHLHFNWDHEELVSAEQSLNALKQENVVFAVVFSIPSDNALKLSRISDGRVIPFFSPYITGHSRNNWFRDPLVLKQAKAGLEQGLYKGIGEVHVISGIGPRRDNDIFQGLLKLAKQYDVPFNIHTEASSYKFLEPVCKAYPSVRFIWAHAGGLLGAQHSDAILKSCANVWIELSARDPAHYGGIVDENLKLREAWYNVIVEHANRFMIGTDPVWHAHEANRWYEADEGWKHYSEFVKFHRGWLAQLPEDVATKVRLTNALTFFNVNINNADVKNSK